MDRRRARIRGGRPRGRGAAHGPREEIALITSVAVDLREARGLLARAAGETVLVSAAEQPAAEREVGLFQAVIAQKIEDRLQVEALSLAEAEGAGRACPSR